MYDKGEDGAEIDQEKSSELGHAESMIAYCHKLMKGEGIPINKKKASEIYEKFAKLGNEKAMLNIGIMLLYGDGIPANKKKALLYIKKISRLWKSESYASLW